MRSQYTPFIALSASKASLERGENSQRYVELTYALEVNKINYRKLVGQYNGIEERSFLIPFTEDNLHFALDMMEHFDQESILISDNEGRGKLQFKDGKLETLGFINVTNSKPTGDYTKILGSNPQYFNYK